jgi:murein DD-endopeptidase MepM/ murein hydrolase activator NlpD
MGGKIIAGTIACGLVFTAQTYAQEVEIPRDINVSSQQHAEEEAPIDGAVAAQPVRSQSATTQTASAPVNLTNQAQPAPGKLTVEEMRRGGALAGQRITNEYIHEQFHIPDGPVRPAIRAETAAARPLKQQTREPEPATVRPVYLSNERAFIRLADGFDFPVGKPDAQGYYKARGFRQHGHLGEDWDGVGGGDTDLGDPIYSIGDGVVVFARDCHMGWGNVVIVRHAFREGGLTKNIDSLYGHLDKILVRRGQGVKRGQQIATLGNAHGLYDAHLHLEVRKNIEIGMSRAKFAQDFSNYYDPSEFILSHRHLQGGGARYRVAVNTFAHDARIPWDKLRNYSRAHTGGGSSQSAAALKKALAAQDTMAH